MQEFLDIIADGGQLSEEAADRAMHILMEGGAA